MKAIDIISYLNSGAVINDKCCDTVKSGSIDKEEIYTYTD